MPPEPERASPAHRILLTFDDGPHPDHTIAVLDELSRRGFSAVFFVLGEQLEAPGARTIIERAADDGHCIGNHGYSQQNLTHLKDDEIRSSFRRTEVLIGDLDRGVKLWRPPFGERDARVEHVLASLGYTRMLWNVDSMDWRDTAPPAEWMQRTLEKIRVRISLGFRNTVCLFHDALETTATRLSSFLDRLAEVPDARVARYNPCHTEGLSLPEDHDPPRACLLDPSDAVSFQLAGSRVLARPGRSAVYVLNQPASLLWDVLAEGASETEASHRMARHYGISEDLASQDLQSALKDWRTRGLLGPKAPEMEDPGPWPLSTDVILVPEAVEFEETRSYRFLDLRFAIRYQTADLAGAVHPRFANLQTVASAQCDQLFDVVALSNGFALRLAGAAATRHESLAALAYRLFFAVMRRAHSTLDVMACLHAALASYGDGAFALVANNGGGKSTLAAALASSGMPVHSDDRLFMDFTSGRPAATPNSIGLKRGSWTVLQSRYPGILELPVFQMDDEEVRFLLPPPPADPLLPPVTHIFFPHYNARAATGAHRLTSVEAVQRIAASEGWISSDPAKLRAFLLWIERSSCYALPFSDLDAAIERIGACLRT
ncbi:MAG: PqqD family peptide modification chaperone [Bryobacteraceae bacterium]|jgi:peptidoglycan/xylan/chitin deacetylase (PgdA/CDA1 family)